MLIDHVKITVKAGDGGSGAVAFSHVKMTLGPTGGSGGKGGDVYFEAVPDLGALRRFRAQKSFAAENGLDGRSAFRDGRAGSDLVLFVPRGTVIHNHTNGAQYELTKVDERVLVLKGGRGGKGNFLYKSSKNTSPKEFQPGLPGEEGTLELELKIIADIGLIGLPNVGKSSLLNEVTKAKSRVANYPFTTLEPHLGVYHELIIADIPGLIEGASSGKGLGIKFLRHIERTRILFHCIDAQTHDPLRDYHAIRKELGAYNSALLKKEEYLIITKTDAVEENRLLEIKHLLAPLHKETLAISIYDPDRMSRVRALLDRVSIAIF